MDAQLTSDVQLPTADLGQLPEPKVNPIVIAVSGLPGTGKSYFCQKLAERLPFTILESDVLRKIIFSTTGCGFAESSRLFGAIYQLIDKLLQKRSLSFCTPQIYRKGIGNGIVRIIIENIGCFEKGDASGN